MANHKSAEKRARQNTRRQARNTAVKNALKTFERKVTAAISEKSAKNAGLALQELTSKMMKAVTKGVMKKETVSRKISRLATRVSQISK